MMAWALKLLRGLLLPLRAFNLVALTLCKQLSVLLVAGMTLIILLQVFCRYVLNNALPWSEELALYLMVWMTFITLPIASYKGQHAALVFLAARLGDRARALLEIILFGLILLVLVLALDRSWAFASKGANILMTSLPASKGWAYVSLPLGFSLCIAVYLELTLDALRRLFSPLPVLEADDPAARQRDDSPLRQALERI